MSVEAITWALKQPVERSTAKFVLVAFANCADSDWRAWPSIAYLCEATAQDRKTVIDNLKRLRDEGFIEATDERRGATGQVVVYALNRPENGTVKQARKRNGPENGTVPFFPPKGPVFPIKQARKRDPDPSLTVRNRNTTLVALSDLVSDGLTEQTAQEFIDHRKRKKAALTPRAWDGIKAEASKAGWSIEAAIVKTMARGWQSFDASFVAKDAPTAAEGADWRSTRSGIEAKGAALGVGKWDQDAFDHGNGEPFAKYTRRVEAAASRAEVEA